LLIPDTLVPDISDVSDFDAVEPLYTPTEHGVSPFASVKKPVPTGSTVGLTPSKQVYNKSDPQKLPTKEINEHYAGLAAKAMAHLQAGNYTKAIPVLRELHNKYPDDLNAVRELGLSLYMANNPAGSNRMALFYLKKAQKLSPDDTATLKTLGLALYKAEELEDASKVIKRYIKLEPDDRYMNQLYSKILRENSAQDGFMFESSDHFDLYYDSSNYRGLGHTVLNLLDDAYRKVETELRLYPDRSVSVILYSARSFREVTLGPDWTGGLYDGKIRLPIKDLDEDNPRLARVLMHEYVHAVVHSFTLDKCPTWLNEGLAMYLEGRPAPQIRLLADLRNLEGSFRELDSVQAQIAYTLSLSAVSFLIDQYGMYKIKQILKTMKKGNSFHEAFNELMPVSYSEFIRQWNEDKSL